MANYSLTYSISFFVTYIKMLLGYPFSTLDTFRLSTMFSQSWHNNTCTKEKQSNEWSISALTQSNLSVENKLRAKLWGLISCRYSVSVGLWRASFCVHYLLFIYVPLLWYVAGATFCTKHSCSHVHWEGKHISTAVAKIVCTHTHIHTKLSQKCTPPTQYCPPPPITTTQARVGDTNRKDAVSPPLCKCCIHLFLCLIYSSYSISSHNFLPAMSGQGHLILLNLFRTDRHMRSDTACCC